MPLRSLIVLATVLALALPSTAQAKRKKRRAVPATQAAGLVVRAPALDAAGAESGTVPDAAPPEELKLAGSYSGVRPGKVALPPHPPPAAGPPMLTWSGFMMTEGGSRVFLQMTREVPYTVSQSTRELTVMLRGCRIHRRNNARPVNTSFFATPVAKVQARQQGQDVKVVIGLRKPVQVQPRLEAGEAGYQFLMFDFPAEAGAASRPAAE
jgi:hypothetical protein